MKVFNKLTIALSASLLTLLFVVLLISVLLFKLGITNIHLWFVLFSFVILIIAIYVIYIIHLWIPIQRISEAITSLVKWDEYIEIKVNNKHEIWAISHFINQVVEKVKNLSWELLKWRRVIWEVNAASEIQKSILPNKAPEWIVWLDIIARSRASSEIWWDNFDIIQSLANTIFYIWDVTGHWAPAALIMTMANTAIRAYATSALTTKEIFTKTNALLFQKITTNHFMSAVMLRWDNEKQKMFYTWAGHETIILFSKETWKVSNIKSWWIALKMIKEINPLIEEKEINFNQWDLLALYSDWITEAKNQFWERYWIDRLTKVIEYSWSNDIEDVFKEFTRDYSEYVWSHPQEDDVTLIIIKNTGHYWKKNYIDVWSKQSNKTWITSMQWGWE